MFNIYIYIYIFLHPLFVALCMLAFGFKFMAKDERTAIKGDDWYMYLKFKNIYLKICIILFKN